MIQDCHITEYYKDRRGDSEIPHSAGPDTDFIKGKGLSFFTNFHKKRKERYKNVIQLYWSETADMDAIFYISEYATDIHGRPLDDYMSLWSNIKLDNRFMDLWRSLKGECKDKDTGFIKRSEFTL